MIKGKIIFQKTEEIRLEELGSIKINKRIHIKLIQLLEKQL